MHCSLCLSEKYSFYLRLHEIELYRCDDCGIVRGHNRVQSNVSEADDWLTDLKIIESYYDPQFSKKNQTYLKYLEEQKITPPGDVLDIGCAYGAFLHAAAKQGWGVAGVEFSPTACEVASKKFGLHLVNGLYGPGTFPGREFHLVTLFDVIEHIEDPVSFLKDIYKNLTAEGRLMLTVPNLSSITSWACIASYRLSFGRITMPVRLLTQVTYHSHHIWYFNLKSLTQLLEIAGFRVEAAKTMTTLYAEGLLDREGFRGLPAWLRGIFVSGIKAVQGLERILRKQDTWLVIASKS